MVEMEQERPGVEEISGAIHKDISVGYREASFFLFALSPPRAYIVVGIIALLLFLRRQNCAIALSFRYRRNRWLIFGKEETNRRGK